MSHHERRAHDTVELLPLKSALVNNNNYRDEEDYYPPAPVFQKNPSSSNLYDYTLLSKRTPASKRLLSKPTQQAAAPTPLVTLCGAPAPSCRREEQAALANLRKKVSPALLHHDRYNRNVDHATKDKEPEELDNRPKLLKKVLLERPVSMVVQWSEVRTAWQDSDFITESLCWHNVYRQRHGAPQLVMAPELCDYAQAWANHLAHTNKFSYRNDRDVGQNLYQRPVSALQPDATGQEVSSYWYAAVRQYNFFKESDVLHANVNAGHFTQMVWVATRFFGVGKARSRAGKVIVVANYSPPGNLSGQFEANVLPPLPETMPDAPPPEH
ncbi:probable pathogenesis-related protein CaO19.6200 [Plutella xylostella]|uniref:probable pathogenesis-related protein CaO19.6200 n=1 Tax=Plutella xylostella TaxID=51655 RepID=UPI0005D057C0|nr:probable pathogenesis-related protein CaO19.6200 [Plutella xylostella]